MNLKITHIALRHLTVLYENAQRPYNDKWAQHIADTFDPDLLDPVTVTGPNEDGMYHIIKGQHRVSGLRKYFIGDTSQLIPCIVLATADRTRSAEIFLQDSTNSKAIKAVDRFNVAVTAKRPDEMAITEIVHSLGYSISHHATETSIFAVNALLSVYKKYGPITLRRTLEILISTWQADRNALQGELIRGYGLFLHTRASKIDWVRLRTCMQKITPSILIARGKAKAHELAKPLAYGIENQIFEAYNGLKTSTRGRKPKSTIARHANGRALSRPL